MDIRKTITACASACLLCFGPAVATAQTGDQEPREQQHQQQYDQPQQQQYDQPQQQQYGQQQQQQREQRAHEQEQRGEREQRGQPEQRAETRRQPGQQQAQTGQRGGNLFASLDREQRRDVQRQLQQGGHYDGDIDGIYGPMTRSALRNFQQQENLEATGSLNQETARALGIDVAGEQQRVAGTTGERERGQQAGQQAESRISARGQQVRQAQQALQREGFHDGAIDGLLGPVTERSIREFQRAQGLRVTGDLSPQTLDALGVRGQEQQGQQAMQQGPESQRGMQQGAETQRGMQQGQQREQGTQQRQSPQAQRTPGSPDQDRDIDFEGDIGSVEVR